MSKLTLFTKEEIDSLIEKEPERKKVKEEPEDFLTCSTPSSNVGKDTGYIKPTKLNYAQQQVLNAKIQQMVPSGNLSDFSMNNAPVEVEICTCCLREVSSSLECMNCEQTYCGDCCNFFVDKEEKKTVSRCLKCLGKYEEDAIITYGHFFQKCCKVKTKYAKK